MRKKEADFPISSLSKWGNGDVTKQKLEGRTNLRTDAKFSLGVAHA